MIARIFLIAFLLTSAAFSAETQVQMDDGRLYSIALPENVKSSPLVIALHGGGGNGAWMARVSGLSARANRLGMAVVYPDGSGRMRLLTWNAGHCCAFAAREQVDDVAFLARVVDDAVARFGIDRRNVFVTGMSNGGMMAERLAADRPDMIAAVASIAGPLDTGLIELQGRVPLLHIQGTADDFVPWNGGQGSKSVTREKHPAAEDTINAWLLAMGPGLVSSSRIIDKADDGMRTERHVWTKAGDEKVLLYRVIGGGHSWPGGSRDRNPETKDFNASDEILEFFWAHLRR